MSAEYPATPLIATPHVGCTSNAQFGAAKPLELMLRRLREDTCAEQERLDLCTSMFAIAAASTEPEVLDFAVDAFLAAAADQWTEIRSAAARSVPEQREGVLTKLAERIPELFEPQDWRRSDGACRLLCALAKRLRHRLPPRQQLEEAINGAADVRLPASRYADPLSENVHPPRGRSCAEVLQRLTASVDALGTELSGLHSELNRVEDVARAVRGRGSSLSPVLVRRLVECLGHERKPVAECAAAALLALVDAGPDRAQYLHQWLLVAATGGQRYELAESALSLLGQLHSRVPAAQLEAEKVRDVGFAGLCSPKCAVRQAAAQLVCAARPPLEDSDGVHKVVTRLVDVVADGPRDWNAVDGALMALEDILLSQVRTHAKSLEEKQTIRVCSGQHSRLLRLVGGGPDGLRQRPDGGDVGAFDIDRGVDQVLPPLCEALAFVGGDFSGAVSAAARFWMVWKTASYWLCGGKGGAGRCPFAQLPDAAREASWALGGCKSADPLTSLYAARTRLLLVTYFALPTGSVDVATALEHVSQLPETGAVGVHAPAALSLILPDTMTVVDPPHAERAFRCMARLLDRTTDSSVQTLLLEGFRRGLLTVGHGGGSAKRQSALLCSLPCFVHVPGGMPAFINAAQSDALCVSKLRSAAASRVATLQQHREVCVTELTEVATGASLALLSRAGTEPHICRVALSVVAVSGPSGGRAAAAQVLGELARAVLKRAKVEGLRLTESGFEGMTVQYSDFDESSDESDAAASPATTAPGHLLCRLRSELHATSESLVHYCAESAGPPQLDEEGTQCLKWLLAR